MAQSRYCLFGILLRSQSRYSSYTWVPRVIVAQRGVADPASDSTTLASIHPNGFVESFPSFLPPAAQLCNEVDVLLHRTPSQALQASLSHQLPGTKYHHSQHIDHKVGIEEPPEGQSIYTIYLHGGRSKNQGAIDANTLWLILSRYNDFQVQGAPVFF